MRTLLVRVLLGCAGLSFVSAVGIAILARPDSAASPVLRLVAGELTLQVPVLIATHLFLQWHGTDWRRAFQLVWNPRAWAMGIGVGLAAVLIGYPLQYLAAEGLRWLGREPKSQEAVLLLAEAGWGGRATIGLMVVVGAAFAEEVLFRGIFYQSIRDTGRPRLAVWVTAVLFGAIHFNLAAFVPLALFGAALAWLYERTGTLGAGIAAHATFNLVGFIAAVFPEKFLPSP